MDNKKKISLDFVFVCACFGQPAARRANIDFERSERERIHFETATRVMNYEIQAQRAEVEANKELAVRDDIDGQIAPVVRASQLSRALSVHPSIFALVYLEESFPVDWMTPSGAVAGNRRVPSVS